MIKAILLTPFITIHWFYKRVLCGNSVWRFQHSLELFWFGSESSVRINNERKALEHELNCPVARARIYIDYQRYNDAIEELKRVLEMEPDNDQARFLLDKATRKLVSS